MRDLGAKRRYGAKMSADMADFKLSFRPARKRSGGRGSAAALDEIAAEIRALDEAGQRAGRRISQSARKLRSSGRWHPGGDDDLLAELADALAARADELRADWGEVSALVERARALLAASAEPAQEPAPDAAPEQSREAAPEQSREAAPAPPVPVAAPVTGDAHPEVRLVATRMAISGATREEIAQHLRTELAFGDAEALLDEIFGSSRRRPRHAAVEASDSQVRADR
jgi:hypothetical protein